MASLLNDLVAKLCLAEKGKEEMNAGQARQVLAQLKDLSQLDHEYLLSLLKYLTK